MWLFCTECGSTLPSDRARCPVCDKRAEPQPTRPRCRLLAATTVISLLAVGVIALGIARPPFLVTLAAAINELGLAR
jgi:predicted amidophosphoribosyltransferase